MKGSVYYYLGYLLLPVAVMTLWCDMFKAIITVFSDVSDFYIIAEHFLWKLNAKLATSTTTLGNYNPENIFMGEFQCLWLSTSLWKLNKSKLFLCYN